MKKGQQRSQRPIKGHTVTGSKSLHSFCIFGFIRCCLFTNLNILEFQDRKDQKAMSRWRWSQSVRSDFQRSEAPWVRIPPEIGYSYASYKNPSSIRDFWVHGWLYNHHHRHCSACRQSAIGQWWVKKSPSAPCTQGMSLQRHLWHSVGMHLLRKARSVANVSPQCVWYGSRHLTSAN